MNKPDGKLRDVIVEDNEFRDPQTGISKLSGLRVWADAGNRELIRNIPGVSFASEANTLYTIELDPRYDREFVKREIEAVLLCKDDKP
jgi:hypothetical protein